MVYSEFVSTFQNPKDSSNDAPVFVRGGTINNRVGCAFRL